MNIFQKLHKLIDLSIQAAEASIKGHNAAYESFKEGGKYSYRYYQDHIKNIEVEKTARKAEYKFLEGIERDREEEKRFAIISAIIDL